MGKLNLGGESRMAQRKKERKAGNERILQWSKCGEVKALARKVTTGVKRKDRERGWTIRYERTECVEEIRYVR